MKDGSIHPVAAPELGRRTASIGLASLLFLGVVSFFPNDPTWSTVALAALVAIGVAAGIAAGRWLDVVAVAAGGALGISLVGVMQLFVPSGPGSYTSILTAAFLVGGLAAICAGATFALRRAMRPSGGPWAGRGLNRTSEARAPKAGVQLAFRRPARALRLGDVRRSRQDVLRRVGPLAVGVIGGIVTALLVAAQIPGPVYFVVVVAGAIGGARWPGRWSYLGVVGGVCVVAIAYVIWYDITVVSQLEDPTVIGYVFWIVVALVTPGWLVGLVAVAVMGRR